MRIKSICKYKRQIKQQAHNNSTVNRGTPTQRRYSVAVTLHVVL